MKKSRKMEKNKTKLHKEVCTNVCLVVIIIAIMKVCTVCRCVTFTTGALCGVG